MSNPAKSNSIIDAISNRRSVRAYAPHKLDIATINTLLLAATRAPTAMHEEPWAFVVIQDTNLIKRISDLSKGYFVDECRHDHLNHGGHALHVFQQPDFNIFYNAPTLIIICGDSTKHFVEADCWLAAENLILAAYSLELGTCVIGSAITGLNTREMKIELGIPAGVTAIAPIVVGAPGYEIPLTPRKEPKVLAWK